MKKIQITEDNFEKEVLKHKGKVLLDFYADWCVACKVLSPTLSNLSKEINNVKIAYINIEENPKLSQQYKVMSIPTLCLVENGEVKDRKVGALSLPQLKQFINE